MRRLEQGERDLPERPPEAGAVEDSRRLSRLALRLAGERLLPLTSRLLESFEASFVLRNPVVAGLGLDEVAILRRRTVAGGLEERIELRNLSRRELSFPLDLELASDFADIFTVKENDPDLDRPERPRPLPQAAPAAVEERGRALRFSDREPSKRSACGDANRALANRRDG